MVNFMINHASFIGLGSMGTPIALNLLRNGIKLFVYNRTIEKAAPLAAEGAQPLSSPAEAFIQAEVVFSMVSNDQALLSIVEGPEGILANAKAGCIHVSLSTVSPDLARSLTKKHLDVGVQYISAPVFGRPDVAAAANLWIALAGNNQAKQKVEPLLHYIGQKIYDFGEDPGVANGVKLTGNFLILSIVELLAEAFAFAKKSNIDLETFHNFICDSLFPSPVFKTYGY
jgi:3-hydroxyisobutyrate dehydrogenase-like beta-hydroxyacid dehydrogenase